MAEEAIVNSDTSNADEELDLELEPETTPSAEDVETLKAQLAELEKKNRQLYARVKKTPKVEQPPIKKVEEVGDIRNDVSEIKLWKQKMQFAYENNLSPDETEKVFLATNNKPTKEVLEDPFIKAGIQAVRKAKKVEEATPSPSGKSSTFNGKTFSQMNEEERKKFFEARAKR